MAEQSRDRHRNDPEGIRAHTVEPEVRRWPHPVDGVTPPPPAGGQTDAALYYIHCALSYQNQLLADIKTLLEQVLADSAPYEEEG